jgi:ankyrin repeat protein
MFLEELGSDFLTAQDASENTPLQIAAHNRHAETVRVLVEKKGDAHGLKMDTHRYIVLLVQET